MHLSKNGFGLVVGFFFAILHAVWSLLVAVIPVSLERAVNWIFKLHSISIPFKITAFNLTNAIILVVLTFIIGYIFGWVIGALVAAFKKEIRA